MLVSNQYKALDESQTAIARIFSEAMSEASEVETLKMALRDCRKRLYRGALESTRRIIALSTTASTLDALNQSLRQRIEALESAAARREPGEDEQGALMGEVHRSWTLKKNLLDAHAEYSRVVDERNALASECAELRSRMDDWKGK